ncbi:MAG: hypothetical protein WD872_18240 [Pirellulaceae bacterium]
MVILALTQFGILIGLPSLLLCAGLMTFLLVAPLPRPDGRAKVATSKVFIFASLAFAAVWIWLRFALPGIAWMFFLGDRNHWFYDHSSTVAALVALLVSCAAFLRPTLGTASRRYVRFLTWAPPILLVAAAAVAVDSTLSPVQGLSGESAAQSILNSNVPGTNATMRLQAHTGPPMDPDTPIDNKSFWIVDGGEKVGLIVVRPNSLIGWQHSRSHRFSDSTDILIDAQVYVKLGENEKARYCLEQILSNLPGTPAEKEARRLLTTIDAKDSKLQNHPNLRGTDRPKQ